MTTIEKIHQEFSTAQERLLAEAKSYLEQHSIPESTDLEAKAERLRSLGFTKAIDVQEADKRVKLRKAKEAEIVGTKQLADTIMYYQHTYPFLKFITEKEMDRVCAKYKLIHAPVDSYIKTVPEKNLRDIEHAQKLKEDDAADNLITLIASKFSGLGLWDLCDFLGHPDCTFTQQEIIDLTVKYYGRDVPQWTENAKSTTWLYVIREKVGIGSSGYSRVQITKRDGLFIAAPPSHFDLKEKKKTGKFGFSTVIKREVQDPIVFRYVKGGIQILTMWGDEQFNPNTATELHNPTSN